MVQVRVIDVFSHGRYYKFPVIFQKSTLRKFLTSLYAVTEVPVQSVEK